MKKTKIVIWGYPNNTHTHYYTHWAWYNTFSRMGYDTYWFSDSNYPVDFDYKNCLFITEGYADSNIPINNKSTYFVHICVNPSKYLDKGARLIDLRFNVSEINDCNYNMTLDKSKLLKVGNCAYYDENVNDDFLSDQFRKGVSGYEALYISWATHLMPDDINLEDAKIKRENKVYWTGSIAENNIKEIRIFVESLRIKNIDFTHSDPWRTPVDWDTLKRLTQLSFISPDIRGSAFRREINGKPDTGSNHKMIGYIPCRIFKNISFGQLGITNSKSVYELFDGNIIYNDDESLLLDSSIPFMDNIKMIQDQMQFVKENHTFLDRANTLIKILNNR